MFIEWLFIVAVLWVIYFLILKYLHSNKRLLKKYDEKENKSRDSEGFRIRGFGDLQETGEDLPRPDEPEGRGLLPTASPSNARKNSRSTGADKLRRRIKQRRR